MVCSTYSTLDLRVYLVIFLKENAEAPEAGGGGREQRGQDAILQGKTMENARI